MLVAKPTVNSWVGHLSTDSPVLKPDDYIWIKNYLYKHTGIALNDNKQALVTSRLERRLRHHACLSYNEYFQQLGTPDRDGEATIVIDLLTTNETYFFREPQQFKFLAEQVLAFYPPGEPLRFWSAASSSGEEAYTLAMLVAQFPRLRHWEIVGTDISTRMLKKARQGLYPLSAAEKIPQSLLEKFCLKGNEQYEGMFLIEPNLRSKVSFLYANLTEQLPKIGLFHVIFLRNVMIYFDKHTKQQLLDRIQHHLRPGGYFFISQAESLNGLRCDLKMVSPSIYQKIAD